MRGFGGQIGYAFLLFSHNPSITFSLHLQASCGIESTKIHFISGMCNFYRRSEIIERSFHIHTICSIFSSTEITRDSKTPLCCAQRKHKAKHKDRSFRAPFHRGNFVFLICGYRIIDKSRDMSVMLPKLVGRIRDPIE